MKTNKLFIYLFLIFISTLFYNCESWFTLDDDEVVIYEGKIFEAFDKSKPIDSVFVEGCTQKVLVLFSGAECDTETFTNKDGSFFIKVEANGLEGRGIRYSKEGYRNIDSCVTLDNGKLECYMKALPTYFKLIIVGTSLVEFDYDKAVISYKTQDKDSVINYTSQSFIGNNNIMRYYWSSDPSITTYSSEINAIYDLVPDNSTVTLKGEYFKNGDLLQTEFDTLFCKKGVGNSYPIRKYE